MEVNNANKKPDLHEGDPSQHSGETRGGENRDLAQDAQRDRLVTDLRDKAQLKLQVWDNTFEVLSMVKGVLHELVNDLNPLLEDLDSRIRVEYRDRGRYEAEVRLEEDLLLVSMHTNVFMFDRDHSVWNLAYVQQDKRNAYCGVIHLYNFLSDSFKYNRNDDLGYLVGRIFVNRNRDYFVEGKRQMGFLSSSFGSRTITREAVRDILLRSMQYVLDFDLLTPPYDLVKMATVGQMNSKVESANLRTGKRLGFQFRSDDVQD